MKRDGRKKILIITDVFRIMAGSERNITHLMKGMDPTYLELIVASFVSGGLAQEMRNKGFAVHELNGGGLYSIRGIRNLSLLRKLIQDEDISLIVTYHESSDFYGLVLSRLCHIPVISNRRDMGFKTELHHKIAYRLFGKSFDAVITVSDAVRDEVVNRNWFRSDRIVTIYNGVNINEYNGINNNDKKKKIKETIGIETGHSVIGLIANLRKIKGVLHFIEAASIISKMNADVQFIVIGEDMNEPGCTKRDLELFAKQCRVDKYIRFLGKRTDIPDLISLMDIGVVSSLSEGFSNTILEYMAASKPVVATNVGGNKEAVIHGETGLLVPPESAEALAKAVLSLIKNNEMASQFGTAGRKRIEENFSLEKMIKDYENLFKQVIADPKE